MLMVLFDGDLVFIINLVLVVVKRDGVGVV